MSETISKASVCEILADIYPTDGEKVVAVREVDKAYEAIQQLPSAQQEWKSGKWEEREVSSEIVIDEWQSARCSACGKYHTTPYPYYFEGYDYCPNCGADMRGEE